MKLIVSLLVILATQASFAQYDLSGRWGLGLGAGVDSVMGPDAYKDGATELKSKFQASVWGRYHLTSRLGLELAYSRKMLKFENTTLAATFDPTIDIVDLSFAYRIFPTDRFHILLQAGAGYARLSDWASTESQDDFTWKGRLGFEYMATQNLMLALHGDYTFVNIGSGTDSKVEFVSPSLALTYYFGGSSSKAVAAADADGDGIADAQDKCAGTPVGTNVGGDGCPLKADADGDGIADADDKCSGTPAGQPVNEFGCAKTEKLQFTLNVQFAAGSSTLDPKSTEDLNKFADFMTEHANVKAEIEGHTDNTGAEKYNYTISQRRANSVMNYLVKTKKIDKARLTAKGYGPSQPVGDNTTAEGRAQNRRVVAHVQTEK